MFTLQQYLLSRIFVVLTKGKERVQERGLAGIFYAYGRGLETLIPEHPHKKYLPAPSPSPSIPSQ